MDLTLQHSPADILRYALIQNNQGADIEVSNVWPIVVAVEPASPENCITIYNTDGQKDGRSMVTSDIFTHFGVQIRVRCSNEKTGFQKANMIRDALAQIYYEAVTIDSDQYLLACVTKIGSVLGLGKDAPNSKRSLFTINTMLAVRRTA